MKSDLSTVATIGNFDGVHKGHQALIARVKQAAAEQKVQSLLITFENHPMSLFKPEQKLKRLCSLNHRILLLEKQKLDNIAVLKFTHEFAAQSAEEFLNMLATDFKVVKLILGSNARFGKGREGDRQKVMELAPRLPLVVEYIDILSLEGKFISSSRIRHLLQNGELDEVEKLLGRKFSVIGPIAKENGKFFVSVKDICMPPDGVYSIQLKENGRAFDGAARLQGDFLFLENFDKAELKLGEDKEVVLLRIPEEL